MRGFPKRINTKQDVYNLLEIYPKETKAYLSDLITTKALNYWIPTGSVDSIEAGITDETHKVMESNNVDGTTSYTQYEYVSNPDAFIYRLGFTLTEVEDIINGNY